MKHQGKENQMKDKGIIFHETQRKEKRIEHQIVKGYDDIEKALKKVEDNGEWIWIGESNDALGRWLLVRVDRKIFVNVGLLMHEFYSFSSAINYITEFLFN